MYICICHGVTDNTIKKAIDDGAQSMREISRVLGVGTQCGKCTNCTKKILNDKLIDVVMITDDVA